MKLLLLCAAVFWLVAGVAGAVMLDGVHNMHVKTIARGPLGLVDWFNDNSVPYPGN